MANESELEKELRAAIKSAWGDGSEEWRMEVAAVDELSAHFGVAAPGSLETFLRSDLPIPQYVRTAMADALKVGRLRIVRPKGRPRSTMDDLAQRIRQLEISDFVATLISSGLPQKAAVTDASVRFGVTERTIGAALRADRARKANRD